MPAPSTREEKFDVMRRKLGTYTLTLEEIDLVGPEFVRTLNEEQRGLLVKDLEAAEADPKMQIAAGQMLLQREAEKKRKIQQERVKKKLKRKRDRK